MSGPIPLEPGGGQDDTLSLRLAAGTASAGSETTLALRLPRIGLVGRRSRTDDPVDRLAAELADRIGPAVHAYEVAALLESEGLTGERIQRQYGHPDLFSLAEDLFRKVPRSFPEPPSPPDPWAPDHVRCVLRGALFALPALAYLLVPPLQHGGREAQGLIAAALLSWAWGQALGHRTHLRLAVGTHEAGRTLLAGAPTGALLASAVGAAVAGTGPAALFAAAQSCYLAAAGVLLVLGRERVLLATLVPVTAGAAALPWWEPGPPVRTGLPLLTLALAVAAAGHAVRGTLKAPPVPDVRRPPLRASVPYGLFGLAAGVLVLWVGRGHTLAVVVLTVSMGPAEWLLYRYRGLSVAALRAATTPRGFRLRSAAVLTGCLTAYVLPLIPGALLTGADALPLVALGATLWTALLLQAFGIGRLPAAICCAVAAGLTAAHLLNAPPAPLTLALSCGAAAVLLIGCALWLLGRPTAHA
ncbi:hypothetical protein KQY30_03760 [Streptomyces sp. GMY02]|uniref:hypothetical protein n=1 Tax=Streptomyces sp. GMY02 TaxID=1333528 RepID=UPI001C2C2BA2|nr:hypothetical protein [Streptomyces sp. GMY02]QXE33535.1 hypothetical protein KQY30_03760 [Streptomyces sp. GMY02]